MGSVVVVFVNNEMLHFKSGIFDGIRFGIGCYYSRDIIGLAKLAVDGCQDRSLMGLGLKLYQSDGF